MKLSTLKNHSRDGRLLVVSRDLAWAVDASDIAATLQDAIERWSSVENVLRARYDALNGGTLADAFVILAAGHDASATGTFSGSVQVSGELLASFAGRVNVSQGEAAGRCLLLRSPRRLISPTARPAR